MSQNPTVTVTYNTQTEKWTFGGNINASNGISVSRGNNTVTFNLQSPSGAVFQNPPFTWSGGQPACISNIQGGLSTTASFDDNNQNSTKANQPYGFEVTILLNYGTSNQQPVTSSDPTIINEGTGQTGDGDGDRDEVIAVGAHLPGRTL